MREIIIKDKVWICSDGETWHAGQPNDRLIYNWAHVPIMAGGMVEMQFQKVGTEQRNGEPWLHVRLKVPEKNVNPKELPQYWLVLVAEYSKGFNWLPKDSHLQWLKKEIVTIDGRKWADWRYVPMLKGTRDYSHSPVYTRFLTTSYKGQLLEITFTSNLNTAPELKQEIDRIMNSAHLEE
jgi:hypothetical protein